MTTRSDQRGVRRSAGRWALLTAAVAAAMLAATVIFAQAADAASTLGASAAEKGRYFGAAIAAPK